MERPDRSSVGGELRLHTDDFRRYLDGEALYGDDFSLPEIEKWYQDEKEAYFRLLGTYESAEPRTYGYHRLNWQYGFQQLPNGRFLNVLGVGSAWGAEFEPILDRIDQLTILEPSGGFVRDEIGGVPVRYIEPRPSGEFPFEEGVFDLISCLGVLHHVPNVSKVVQEISRCLTPGGHALIREPTISMGDWRESRPGLTTRERGIPLDLLRGIIKAAGLEVTFEKRCMFQLTYNLAPFFHNAVWNSRPALLLDRVFCSLFASNLHYHPWNRLQTLRPIAVYYVLRRPPKAADL